jgi:hypothetical protein
MITKVMKRRALFSLGLGLFVLIATCVILYFTGWRVVGTADNQWQFCGHPGWRDCGTWTVEPWYLTRYDSKGFLIQGIHIGDYWTPMLGFIWPDDPTIIFHGTL